MRLDDYLLKHGVRCKETADYLVKNMMVMVNGKIVTYTALPLEEKDRVEVLKEEYKDAPASFWKLKVIHESVDLIHTGDFVLDIESPDGGFPLFAARTGANTTVVTIREDLDFLKREGIEVINKNIVHEDLRKIFSSKFDIVIIELNFDIMKTMQILEKLRDFIGSRGKVIMFLPSRGRENVKEMIEEMMLNQKLIVVKFFDTRKGFYVYAKVI
ncbi:MAG: hypothetical protein KAT37_00270 [Candidatus Aenigmarchaeota archaeon]|nr:hypothetical protein [Candidatus Aenigmarchaeota archaeon]